MEIKVSTTKSRVPITVLHVTGNIDSATYEAFAAKANELIAGGARYFLIDLTNAPFVSSAGLRAMHGLFTQLRALTPDIPESDVHRGITAGTYKSPHLKLLNLSRETRTAFEMAGFDMYIDTFTDMDAAVSAF